jgi:signal transduction histidine kinase/streptogramin lyase
MRQLQLLAIALAAALFLGQRAAADPPYTVDTWSTDEGLPQGSVIAMTQTHDGYLWLGTLNGLVRFDGNSFTPFNVNNTPGLPDNRVIFLFEDSQSNLWTGTENAGLCRIRNGAVKRFDVAGTERITCGFEEAGAVWFYGSTGNLFCWRDGKLEARSAGVSRAFALDFLNRAKHIVVPGKNGVAWRLQGGRVARYLNGSLEKDFGACPWPSSLVPWGNLQIDATVRTAVVDGEGNLVVGTFGSGVYWISRDGRWRHVVFGRDSLMDSALALCIDREGNLWAGTDGGGIYRVKKSYFDAPAGLSTGVAKSVAETATGDLWVAFNARGMACALSNRVTSYPIGPGSNPLTVLVERQQQVWAGTRGEGLFRFASGGFQLIAVPGWTSPQISVFALFEDRQGTLWAGSDNGLAGFDGQAWKTFTTADGLPGAAVRALAEDAAGDLWIGTEGGLGRLHEGKISAVTAPVKDISCLLAGKDGVLWAGTSGHGLARLAQGRWTVCSSRDGLAADDIGYLIEDDYTNLWIGSFEGLLRVAGRSLAAFAADPARKIACRTFLTRECSAGAQPAAIRIHDGRLLFPTIAGVVSVNPADVQPNTNPPPVVIESVLVDGVPQRENPLGSTWPQAIVLQPENEQLEIHFTALSFSAPKGARFGAQFKYQLEGHDNKATDIGAERVARFGRLTPGSYVFHVSACNEDGFWNTAGASVAIIVEPPFWRKPWFVTASLLGFLAALAGAIYLISTAKLRRQLRLAQQKELIEGERARIARDLHDQLGANLTQITLLGEMAEADKELPKEIEQHAGQICATARETTRALDEIVWAVNPSNDTLESLANYACKYAQDYFAMAGVRYRSELPSGLPPTPILPEVRHNVFLAYKEAVNNVVKHARATEAHVKLELAPDRFILSVADNGRGLGDLSQKKLRNGLKNMRRRLADAHGEFEIAPAAGGGTIVKLTVPLQPPG